MSSRPIADRLRDLVMEDYIRTHSDPEPEVLGALAYRAHQCLVHPRMMSGHLQGRLLKMLVRMIAPMRVLELGTYAAYATLCMAEALPEGALITTIEREEELEPFVTDALHQAGVEQTVELRIGDAMELLGQMDLGQFDLVYVDANKRQYPEYHERLMQGLRSGAFVIADNTLWDGKVVDPSAHDPQTEGIRRYNDLLAEDDRVEQVILPIRDGLTLMYVL